MMFLINKYANNGRGLRRWETLKEEILEKAAVQEYSLIANAVNFNSELVSKISDGERVFIAAGGDGTVNFLLNHLMELKKNSRQRVALGAIGLGSSNDFHKPLCKNRMLHGNIPYRMDYQNMIQHNVGQIDFEDIHHKWHRKYFLLNCSIGIIAQANYLFNSKEKVVHWLKSKWVGGTIWYAALKTLFRAPNVHTIITTGKGRIETDVTNLSILINPYVSGDFHYDFNVTPQSDFFGIALCEKMGILSRVKTIFSLARGKFSGLNKTRMWRSTHIELNPVTPTALELDGEVFLARKIKIQLLKNAMRVCQ
ncbi:diacylglycerol/lipid kinase family protein [bacterium]